MILQAARACRKKKSGHTETRKEGSFERSFVVEEEESRDFVETWTNTPGMRCLLADQIHMTVHALVSMERAGYCSQEQSQAFQLFCQLWGQFVVLGEVLLEGFSVQQQWLLKTAQTNDTLPVDMSLFYKQYEVREVV